MPSRHTGSCEKDSLKTRVVDPDLSGKVVLITGGTGGIGAELVVHLSQIPKPPAHIIFTGRNTNSADAVIERCRRRPAAVPSPAPGPVQASSASADPHPGNPVDSCSLPILADDRLSSPEISFIPMDLSSLESVSTASNQILTLLRGEPASSEGRDQPQDHDQRNAGRGRNRLDILLANAGIMAHPPGLSPDGYEIQFATNHLGHALLIRKLLPLMLETANSPPPSSSSSPPPPSGCEDESTPTSDVRIITTSSTGWRLGKIDNFPFEQLSNGDLFEGRTFFAKSLRYGNSKLANVVYARELALRYGDEAIAASSSPPSSSSSSSQTAAGGGTSGSAHAGGPAASSQLGTRNGGNGNGTGTERSIVPAAGPDSQTTGDDDINLDSISPPTKTTRAAQRKGILSISLTPGVVGTGLVNDLPLTDKALVYVSQLGKILTPEEGIRNHLWALSSPREELVPGAYYEPVGKLWSKSWSDQIEKKDPLLGRRMWDWTEGAIGRWLQLIT